MDTVAESCRKETGALYGAPGSTRVWKMSRLELDGTVKPFALDIVLGANGHSENCFFLFSRLPVRFAATHD